MSFWLLRLFLYHLETSQRVIEGDGGAQEQEDHGWNHANF